MERLPTERAITAQTQAFNALRVGGSAGQP
jgi:predicted TIM-barrel enzyme